MVSIEIVKHGCRYDYDDNEYHRNWQDDSEDISEKNEIDPDNLPGVLPKLFRAINKGFGIRGKVRDKDPKRISNGDRKWVRLRRIRYPGINARF